MLSYAFSELRKNNYDDIDKEDFEHIEDLFAEILIKAVSLQLKQGLYRSYINKKETLPLLRGKIDINGTIRNRIQHKTLISCEFDELSENNILNQALKTTICLLLTSKEVVHKRKVELRKLVMFFSNVDIIDANAIRWDLMHYQRNNQTYRMLMNICYFIIKGLIMTTESGEYRAPVFSDENMCKLYEKFILEFYRVHYPELRANADQIEWDIKKDNDSIISFLPTMRSDITLHKGDKTFIIDAKYYGHMMQKQFEKYSIHSGNLYQIFTYVKNKDTKNEGKVSGMLLYAKTQEEVAPDMDAVFSGNRIMVKTLDLNQPFDNIKEQLSTIIELFDY
jgi:5-methylcytosine-specific restriction enzyme subunit McrC